MRKTTLLKFSLFLICLPAILLLLKPAAGIADLATGGDRSGEPLLRPAAQGNPGYALRFYGHGVNAPDLDRVKIQIDDPNNNDPGPPADVGATDFTLEFWMKAAASDNNAGAVGCGNNINWIEGNIVFDRDRFDQNPKFGLSIAGGVFVFGVSGEWTGERTICGTTNVLDEVWHHIAVERRRSDGWMWLYVDGNLEAQANGPDGDISYPDNGYPHPYCGGLCLNSDPYLVIGAEKHDAGANYPSYSGLVDEVRLSNVIRYDSNFTRPANPFAPDGNTVALYHFDEGPAGPCTGEVWDVSGASGGPSNGRCRYGGSNPAGPVYTTDTMFLAGIPTPTPTNTPSPTDTPTSTPTPTATATATNTPTATPTATATPTNTPTATTISTPTPTETLTPTVTPAATATETATPTASSTPTNTTIILPAPTNTSTPTATPTATSTPANGTINLPTPTATPTTTSTPTKNPADNLHKIYLPLILRTQ